jgi:hypothetical protein
MTFSGTALTLANDASISGLTVGKGGGAVATGTALGYQALNSNSSGTVNTAIGYQAGYTNTTNALTAVGYRAGYLYNTGSETNGSTFIGYSSGVATTSGHDNTFVGGNSGTANTSGNFNIAIGGQALQANTTASNNTAVGYQAGYSNTTGTELTAVGLQSLKANTTGNYNSAVGVNALLSNTTGSSNSALGDGALQYNTTASNNTAVGYQAGYSNTGISNTYVGNSAGYSVTSGTYNICLGVNAGNGATPITTGSFNVHLGYYTSMAAGSNSGCIVIGASATETVGKGSNTGFINPNTGGVYQGNNSASWSTTSDQRLKKNIVNNNIGLEKITAIQVRNFEYRLPEEVDAELLPADAVGVKGVQLGVIAQELQQVLPECVKQETTGVYRVDPDALTWYLINAVKELKAEIDSLKQQLGK